MPSETPRLLARVKGRMRARHLSPRTERSYVGWIIRYIRYHGMRHPTELGEAEIVAYLTHLASERAVSRSTQMQALSALQLLYREVLGIATSDLRRVLRSTSPAKLPAVLSRAEVRAVVGQLHGTSRLIALLLYGAGLRLMECLTLRVKDLDFARGEIRVRRGKGGKDRITMLPRVVRAELEQHLVRVRALHERDVRDGGGRVEMPAAFDRKAPSWALDFAWQWVFPASRRHRALPVQRSGGTTYTRRPSNAPCNVRRATPASQSVPRATRCAIRLQPTYWKTVMTFVRCRSCWATRM